MKINICMFILVIGLLFSVTSSFHLKRLARKFLRDFGYTRDEIWDERSTACKEALIKVQAFAHLKTTGVLDVETEKLMRKSRCQNHDFNIENDFIGSNQYKKFQKIFRRMNEKKMKIIEMKKHKPKSLLWRNPWQRRLYERRLLPIDRLRYINAKKRARHYRYKRHSIVGMFFEPSLTYSLENYPTNTINLTNQQVDETVKWAFDTWLKHATGLEISQVASGTDNADLKVSFVSGNHSDRHPFDGPGGVVGHAFFPTKGEVHLDDAETWSRDTTKGTNLEWVLLHEIGHSLGLGHSMDSNAIMYPYYSKFEDGLVLGDDDIKGISLLYSLEFY